eukprot:3702009-Prymnesium_polylepis.1
MFHQVMLGVRVQLQDSAMELAHLFSLHGYRRWAVGAVTFNDQRLAACIVAQLHRTTWPLDEHLGPE